MTTRELLLDYKEFNPTRFLKESKKWKSKIKELETELDNISVLPSVESMGVQSSNISDLTHNLAVKRIKIITEINEYKALISCMEWALGQMSAYDRKVIEGFFFPKTSIYNFVDTFGRENALCRSDVYASRREALETFADLISTRYEL